jgi:hypothetical protein
MQKALSSLPTFDPVDFGARTALWRQFAGGPGSDRIVIEWGIGTAPYCFIYPAARRTAGFNLLETRSDSPNDERWADFLEFEFVPKIVAAIAGSGRRAQVICADQRPIQVMRARRRATAERLHAAH